MVVCVCDKSHAGSFLCSLCQLCYGHDWTSSVLAWRVLESGSFSAALGTGFHLMLRNGMLTLLQRNSPVRGRVSPVHVARKPVLVDVQRAYSTPGLMSQMLGSDV